MVAWQVTQLGQRNRHPPLHTLVSKRSDVVKLKKQTNTTSGWCS